MFGILLYTYGGETQVAVAEAVAVKKLILYYIATATVMNKTIN